MSVQSEFWVIRSQKDIWTHRQTDILPPKTIAQLNLKITDFQFDRDLIRTKVQVMEKNMPAVSRKILKMPKMQKNAQKYQKMLKKARKKPENTQKKTQKREKC